MARIAFIFAMLLVVTVNASIDVSGFEQIRISVAMEKFNIDEIIIDEKLYSSVNLEGATKLSVVGNPALPKLTATMTIPNGEPVLHLKNSLWKELIIDPVIPSRGHFSRNTDPSTVPYIEGAIYQNGGVFPEQIAQLGTPFIVAGKRGITLQINPFQYDASAGVLRYLESAEYEIVFNGSREQHVSKPVSKPMNLVHKALFENESNRYEQIIDNGKMLIVTDDSFENLLQDFINWKQQRGLDVEVITSSSVGGTAIGIQDAITTRYQSDGLTYVLLVGDLDQIPTHNGGYSGTLSDATYAMVDGEDFYPDLFISRISGSTASQIESQLNKFIRYERDPDSGASALWYSNATGLASNEGNPTDYERCNLLRDDLLGWHFTEVDQIYQPDGTSEQIANAVNSGRSLINYLGHGSGTSWLNPPFASSDVHLLENGNMNPWIIDVSCSNGTFSNDECFAEAWLRAGSVDTPVGAIGMYSASSATSWVPPCVMQAEAVDLLVAEQAATLGALYFYGAMKVLDEYPTGSEGQKLVEQYNIFGDCSLQVRTMEPSQIAATHLPVYYIGYPQFQVTDIGIEGASITLTGNGVVYGRATSDIDGNAIIDITTPVETPTELLLTVCAVDADPYQAVVQAVSPTVVTMNPETVPVNVTTSVTVTVMQNDGTTPLPNIEVIASGIGYFSETVVTDEYGQAVISVNSPYGQQLHITGRESGQSYNLFDELLLVEADELMSPLLTVSSDYGMSGAFPLHLEATLSGSCDQGQPTLWLRDQGGNLIGEQTQTLSATFTEAQTVTGYLGFSGYNIFSEQFEVIQAEGTLFGAVSSNATPIVGASVSLTDSLGQLLEVTSTDQAGIYIIATPYAAGEHSLSVASFGHVPNDITFFMNHGSNSVNVELSESPQAEISGVVTSIDTGDFLPATIVFNRADTGEQVVIANTNPETGYYHIAGINYWDYEVIVSSTGFTTISQELTVNGNAVFSFQMESQLADILIIDDDTVLQSYTDSRGTFQTDAIRSASLIEADLHGLGLETVTQTMEQTDTSTWFEYGFVILSCGDNAQNLYDLDFHDRVEEYVAEGGALIVEGGDVCYTWGNTWGGDPDFALNVLRINSFFSDASNPDAQLQLLSPEHQLASFPNHIPNNAEVTYSAYGDRDEVDPAPEVVSIAGWTGYPGKSILAHDSTPETPAGEYVLFAFNYAAMEQPTRAHLLHNAVKWLLPSVVSIEQETELEPAQNLIPEKTVIYQAYPNPFNPSTTVSFDLHQSGWVTLELFDVAGRKVRTLIENAIPAGHHQAVWDGRTDSGKPVSSGAYFARLTTNTKTITARMLLVR